MQKYLNIVMGVGALVVMLPMAVIGGRRGFDALLYAYFDRF